MECEWSEVVRWEERVGVEWKWSGSVVEGRESGGGGRGEVEGERRVRERGERGEVEGRGRESGGRGRGERVEVEGEGGERVWGGGEVRLLFFTTKKRGGVGGGWGVQHFPTTIKGGVGRDKKYPAD